MKNKNKSLVGIASILFFSVLISGRMQFFSNIFIFSVKNNLRLSDPPIITSPEDGGTYTHGTEGYFPSTYGFESDDDDSLPTGWTFDDIDHISGYAYVISKIGDSNQHKKILDLYDNVPASGRPTKIYNNIFNKYGPKDFGTIELWIRQSSLGNTDKRGQITGTGDSNTIFQVKMIGGSTPKWQVLNGGNNVDIAGAPTPSIDTWYHIRIDFENSNGAYQGLDENKYNIYIDGVCYGPYNLCASEQLERLYLHTYSWGAYYHVYFDAIGYSWDPYYNVGENLLQGLLLDFNAEQFDTMSYQLDANPEITILGDCVIPFPNSDADPSDPDIDDHQITVWGDGVSTSHDFTINNQITILSPESIIYSEVQEEGYYPATYGFDSNEDDSFPTGWTADLINGHAKVVSGIGDPGVDEHKKVLELYDDEGASGAPTKIYNTLGQKYSGTIELWMRQNDLGHTNNRGQITGTKGEDLIFQVKMIGGSTPKWQARDGATTIDIIGAPEPSENTWYHIKIDFEHTEGGYRELDKDQYFVSIDDIRYGPYSFGASEQLERLYLHTYSWGANYKVFFDAIGYSWDQNYHILDNLKQGLLISYGLEPTITLEWIGYQLDDHPIYVLSEYPVLSLYNGGTHLLRIFGEDSNGFSYFSDTTYYSSEPEGWNPITLVGSTSVDIEGQIYDRLFPYDEKLGFEIQSVFPFHQDPILTFSVTKTSPSNPKFPSLGYFRAYLDGELISEEFDSPWTGVPYVREVELGNLRQRRGHQIIIEADFDPDFGDQFKLDYIKISRLECWDIEDITQGEDTNPYTPCQGWFYDNNYDGLTVGIQTKHGALDSSGWLSASTPGFHTSIFAHINPDKDFFVSGPPSINHDYFIDNVSLQIRLVRPDGSYLNWPEVVSFDFHVCKAAYDYNPIHYTFMDQMLDLFSIVIAFGDMGGGFWDDFCEYADDIWTVGGTYEAIFGLLDSHAGNQPPGTFEKPIENYDYMGGWKAGRVGELFPQPSPRLANFSMLTTWEPDLGGEPSGPYQIQITWKVEIWNHEWGFQIGQYGTYYYSKTIFLFSKSVTSYVNFILFPPPTPP